MKKFISVLLLIIILILFTTHSTVNATVLNNYTIKILSNEKQTYLIGINNKDLYVKSLSGKWEQEYQLKDKIFDATIIDNEIYLLCSSTVQHKLQHIYAIKNQKLSLCFNMFTDIVNSDDNLIVDKNGYIYINRSKDKIEVYNKTGNFVKTINQQFTSIINMNGYCYGSTQNKLCKLSKDGVDCTIKHKESSIARKISDNYLYFSSGNIYKLSDKLRKVMTLDNIGSNTICETSKYLVYLNNNYLQAYDKTDYQLKYQYSTDSAVANITACGENIYNITQDYNTESNNANDIFNESTSIENNENIATVSINNFDIIDNYIVVKQGTTFSDFKNEFGSDYVTYTNKSYETAGTDDLICIMNKQYSVVVMGDVTGEGNINSRDIYAIMDHILDYDKLDGIFKFAGDINGDKTITNIDLVMTSQLSL